MTGEAGVWFPRDHILSWNLASPPRWSIQNEGLPRVVILYSVGSSYSPGGVGAREWQNWGSDSERTPEKRGFWVALLVKSPSANAGDLRDTGSIPGSERSPGGGHGNPLQYSCPENPMGRRAWQATVHRVAESDTTEATQQARMHQERETAYSRQRRC